MPANSSITVILDMLVSIFTGNISPSFPALFFATKSLPAPVAFSKGFLDKVAIADIPAYESELLLAAVGKNPELYKTIEAKGALDDDLMNELKTICTEFTQEFLSARA